MKKILIGLALLAPALTACAEAEVAFSEADTVLVKINEFATMADALAV